MSWCLYSLLIFKKSHIIPVIKTKRIYDRHLKKDGYRVLVDGLWPRGITKEQAAVDEWAKDLAPAKTLSNWFDHDPSRWEEFQKRYKAELLKSKKVEAFAIRHKQHKVITLLYATKYDRLTHALILKGILEDTFKPNAQE